MKKLVLCVTGSVAGIKAAELATKLQQSFDVKVVATSHGHVFLDKPPSGWTIPECLIDANDYQVSVRLSVVLDVHSLCPPIGLEQYSGPHQCAWRTLLFVIITGCSIHTHFM